MAISQDFDLSNQMNDGDTLVGAYLQTNTIYIDDSVWVIYVLCGPCRKPPVVIRNFILHYQSYVP